MFLQVFPKWLGPACTIWVRSARTLQIWNCRAVLCARLQGFYRIGSDKAPQLRGTEPPGKQSPSVKGDFRPCSFLQCQFILHFHPHTKGRIFFFFSEDLKSKLVNVSLFCCGYFYFLTMVLLNLFIISHWNCHSTFVSPFRTFLYAFPSSFFASVLFKHMLVQTEIRSNFSGKNGSPGCNVVL